MYCRDKVFEVKQKLYELEQVVEGKKFFRASKSSILNIAKISYIRSSISSRFEARMDNGETVMVSRHICADSEIDAWTIRRDEHESLQFIQHSVVHIYSASIVMYADAARMKQRRLGFG